ncbi:MAG: lysophospholipid transporter LplT [Oxalobacteraceae bacterium]|jgi:LPLT family lysophospholipid transporter-like MFS transporter|nr:lysophospholipid transporter LplT [Oxalobacteraceae bacterium]
MNRGFYTIMAAQFFSSLADNALLIVAISVLVSLQAPAWMTPMLKLFFVLSYVILAPFVGAFADAFPKGRVMFITNLVKITGCLMMFFSVHPLLAYAVVGFGAAAYSPAKYGILTELLPAEKLVAANGWIEGLTVLSIIFGTVLGGLLVSERLAQALAFLLPFNHLQLSLSLEFALGVVMVAYFLAAIFNLKIPDTGVRYAAQQRNPIKLVVEFADCFVTLWRDRLGQISLAVTSLFWGAGATLQFIVLKWAEKALDLPLAKAAILQGVVAFGVAFGAMAAAKRIPLKKSLTVMPMGFLMGLIVTIMVFVHSTTLAYPLLVLIGALSGYFVVPMNALLQHRGHVLMSAGHSIAVQNFSENGSILIMLGLYALLVKFDLSVNIVIVLFGLFVSGVMWMVMKKHAANQREYDSMHLIGQEKHVGT